MNQEMLRDYCTSKKGAKEDFPFGDATLTFKVMNKLFALVGVAKDKSLSINLKCDPALAEVLRDTYDAVKPGYHMNKKHWNTVICDGSIPDEEIFEMIDNSYDLVVKNLRKAERERLAALD